MTISPPLRIVALCGLLAVLGGGLFALLALDHRHGVLVRHGVQAPSVRKSEVTHRSASHHAPVVLHTSVARQLDSGLPAALRHALAESSLVVAVVYAPNIAAEAGAVSAARAGAQEAHVGFVALDVRDAQTAETLATIAPGVSDPAVLIVRRPGTIALDLDGVQDATTVAQAALQVRR
jgi:hypothetical protein